MTKEFIDRFLKNYDKTINYFGYGDNSQLLIPLASKYTIENKQFSGVLLQKVVEKLNEEIKFRNDNYLLNYKIADLLLNEGNIEESISQLKEKVKALEEVGFRNSIYRILGGLSLEGDIHQHAKRAKVLFDELKRNQRFLTSKEDIPYVVSLTIDESKDPTSQANTATRYYQQLKKHEFIIGNHLQALSLIMTLFSDKYNELMVDYILLLRKELEEKRSIRIKKIHYPYLGILALAQTDTQKIEEIADLYFILRNQKPFRTNKDQALIVAIQKTVQHEVCATSIISLSTIERLFYISDFLIFLEIIPLGLGVFFDF